MTLAGQLQGAALALAVTSGAFAVVFYLYARLVRGSDTTRSLRRIRRAFKVGLPLAYLVALFAMAAAGWLDAVDALVVGVPGSETRAVGLLALLVEFGAPTAAVVAAYLGAFPTVRDLRNVDMAATTAALRLFRYAVGLVGLVAVLLVAAGAVTDVVGGTAGTAVAVVLGVLVLFGASPWLTRLLQPTRSPSEDERRRLSRLCEDAGLDVRGTVVLETADAKNAYGLVRGLPGFRYLLISDYLMDVLDDETLRAHLAMTAGRSRVHHLKAKLAALALLAVVPAALLLDLVSVPAVNDVLAGFVSVVLGIAVLWLGARLVYRVDGYAAERTNPEAVVAALRRYADLHDAPTEWGTPTAIFYMEPSVADRIDRLRARDGD